MSYATATALQAALYGHLTGDATLSTLVTGAIYDTPPQGAVPALYVLLGEGEVRDASDASVSGSRHDVLIRVIGETGGFHAVKEVAGRITDLLQDAPLTLSRGALVSLRFRRARAFKSGGGQRRQVDLRFVARIEDTA
ncbi:hypothetical protein PSA7680_00816 [Pseudoruegeria aquimaris]|uniref:Gene transfer agent protein n=1 Tax=Pseudoruegeria aquimaris TaxID=393663 RepID=A0A1Y5RQ12_9RHOB|nr:DUF3168 domain-containing protein [Pseudoruegeria aquimaris]SLN21692.1 hypothetical protein PSA7680_00816 [Pseudoruegeria aquimaris]